MKSYKLKITQEECDLLESLSFQKSAKENIVLQVLTNPALADINKDLYQSYLDDYMNFYIKYEIAKIEISKKYTKYAEQFGTNVVWSISFADCEINVSVDGIDDNQLKEILEKYGE